MLQPGGVNALMALIGAPNPQGTALLANGEEGGLAGQFSQLLGDLGKSYDDQSGAQQFSQGSLLKGNSLAALSAQEMPGASGNPLAELLGAHDQVIAPGDVAALVTRVDAVLVQHPTAAGTQALLQLKEQLQQIAQTGTPRTIGEVLQAVPAIKEAKLSLVGLTALLAVAKPESAEVAEEASAVVAALLQPVPTAIFRPHSADDAAAQRAADEAQKKESDALNTVSVIVPLAAISIRPVADIGIAAPRADLDAAIPPLTLAGAGEESLPEINLPTLTAESAARKADAAGVFQSLAAAAGAAQEGGKPIEISGAFEDKTVTALSNLSPTAGHSATQTLRAAQPVDIVATPGYINHAPVSEQVRVAVHQAAQDGIARMTVQLDPVELGRVEVNIQTNREGQTQILFLVDKPDTFDHLSRDARMLERSLQEAGIKADAGSMQFNLRQPPQPQQLHSDLGGQGQNPHQGQPHAPANEGRAGAHTTHAAVETVHHQYLFNVREGVDISA
ncbi:MAG: flagellar hook-length control protein FliK [Alphaproteobacteria bacterium]|nr:flagellar hook-length control protein FliK [Alphaproteobacteria bacterium]